LNKYQAIAGKGLYNHLASKTQAFWSWHQDFLTLISNPAIINGNKSKIPSFFKCAEHHVNFGRMHNCCTI
jgi:hypothetical protein